MKAKKLHIAVMGTRGVPNAYGGFEQCAEYLSHGLVDKGHSVTVYCSDRAVDKPTDWNGVQLVYCRDLEGSLGTFGQFIYDLSCILHARKQHYDVILQFGYTSSSIWSFLWPKVPHAVNMDGLEFKRSKYSSTVKHFLMWAEKWAVNRADLLIADNSEIKSYFREKYDGSSVKLIAYGSEIPLQEPGSDLLRERLSLEPKSYDLVICRLEPENHVEMIINAHIASKNERSLIVVGGTGGAYGRFLTEKYKDSNTQFFGGIYDKRLLDELRFGSSNYLHGHSVGGTNPSLLEAMATAQTILAHDNSFNRSVLQSNGLYFSTVDELSALLDDSLIEESKTWYDKNHQELRANYTWSRIINQYEELCYELVAD